MNSKIKSKQKTLQILQVQKHCKSKPIGKRFLRHIRISAQTSVLLEACSGRIYLQLANIQAEVLILTTDCHTEAKHTSMLVCNKAQYSSFRFLQVAPAALTNRRNLCKQALIHNCMKSRENTSNFFQHETFGTDKYLNMIQLVTTPLVSAFNKKQKQLS